MEKKRGNQRKCGDWLREDVVSGGGWDEVCNVAETAWDSGDAAERHDGFENVVHIVVVEEIVGINVWVVISFVVDVCRRIVWKEDCDWRYKGSDEIVSVCGHGRGRICWSRRIDGGREVCGSSEPMQKREDTSVVDFLPWVSNFAFVLFAIEFEFGD